MTRSIEQIQADMSAVIAFADSRPEGETALSDDEVQKYEALETELETARKDDAIRGRQRAYLTPLKSGGKPIAAPVVPDEYEKAFDSYLRTGQKNHDLIESYAQSEGTPSAGGYMVPDGFRQKLVDVELALGGIASVAETLVTDTGAPLEYPSITDESNTSELVAENGAPASAGADLAFGTVALGAYKYVSSGTSNIALKVPVELLQDANFDVQSLVARKLGRRIARLQAAHFALGTGSSQPLGLAYAADGDGHVELADGNAITYAKLLALITALDAEYRTGARWVMHDSVWLEIAALVDGTGGRPLVQSSSASTIADSVEHMNLLGYPVTIDNSMNSKSGDNSDNKTLIVFGNIPEAYVIRRVRDVTVVVDPYNFAINGQVGYLAWARADATVQNATARKILSGYDAT